MAKTAEMDAELVAGLKVAKSKRAYFALVLKGSNDGALIVSKTKVPPAGIAEAKKKSGGSAILKGFCTYEDGTYVFETAKQAPATAPMAVKIIAKRDAGLAVKAEFRVSADPELAGEEGDAAGEAPPKAPPAPPLSGDAVVKRFHAMTADIQASLGGPNSDRVKALFAAIRDQLVKKDFAGATKNIDELEPLVKQVKAAAAPKDDGAALIKRWHAMTPDIQASLGGPNSDRVKALFATIRDQLVKKEFAAATKNIDELEPLVKQVKAAAPAEDDGAAVVKRFHALTPDIQNSLGGPDAARVKTLFAAIRDQLQKKDFAGATKNIDEMEALVKQAAPAAPPAPNGADLMKRLNGMTAEIKTALGGPNKARIQPLFVAVSGQLKNKEFDAAAKGLDELEKLVWGARGDGPAKGGAAQKGGLDAALATWTTARSAAVGQLEKLAAAIKTSGHPKAADGFKLLELVIKKQLTPRPATANQVAELVRYIQTDDIFTDAETPNPFGFTVKIREPLLKALGELTKHVA